jgi:hypothetical protein
MLRHIIIVSGALMICVASSTAQQKAVAKACAADIKAQCAGVQPGEGRIKACINDHFKDLSEPCQAGLTKVAAIAKVCAADVKQNCADVKPGGGRMVACIKSHMADLSQACKDGLTQAAAGKS